MSRKISLLQLITFILFLFFFANAGIKIAYGDRCACDDGYVTETEDSSDCRALCTSRNKNTDAGTVKIDNPLGTTASPQQLIGKIINAALGVVGSIALLMFIYGGFVWMTAAGGAEGVKKGKDIIVWATIGLIVIFASYGLVNFVLQGIGASTT